MAYLYGDGTPSALQIDYLGYLRRALALAVEIVIAEDQLVAVARRARGQEARIAQLEARLEALHQTVRGAIAGAAGSPEDDTVSRCANQLEGAVEGVVSRAIAEVHAQRAAVATEVTTRRRTSHAACLRALETFLRAHDLPDATRVVELAGGRDGVTLQLHATTPYGVAYELELDRGGPPLGGAELRAGDVQKSRLSTIKLDRLLVTTATCDPRVITMEVRSGREATADGFELVRDRAGAGARARLFKAGAGGEVDLRPDDERGVAALADALGALLEAAGSHRKRVVAVTIDDTPLDDHDRPSTLVDRVFAAMAPHVRAIVERSKIPGELSLRKELGGDRREEIFVTHAALGEMVAQVPSARRRHFAVLGLPGLPGVEAVPTEDDVEIVVDSDSSISIQIEG